MTAVAENETRERLLRAALEVFERDGYDGARVSEIARRAGLTTGAIYSQYRGKTELLVAAIATRTREEIDALVECAPGEQACAVLATIGSALMSRAAEANERQPLLIDALSTARRDEQVARLVRASLERRERMVADLVERARASGDIAADVDARAVARFCVALAVGSMALRAIAMAPVGTDGWDALLERLLHSIAPSTGAALTKER